MTTRCEVDPEDAERYVSGGTTEPARSAFEEHFFACNACLERVEQLQALQQALAEPIAGQQAAPRRLALLLPVAAAAAIVLAVLGRQVTRPATVPPPPPRNTDAAGSVAASPAPSFEASASIGLRRREAEMRLAEFVPPRYSPLPPRGAGDDDGKAFDAAMAHYVAGRYREAATALRALTRRSPDLAPAQFFLGISELAMGEANGARTALAQAVESNQPPYADEAHFYLAKSALRLGDRSAAERELQIALGRDADHSGEARRLLAELKDLSR